MAARVPRRLPGFRFEVQTPPLDEVLPRMDVTCFVGFARSGPIDKPVAVGSIDQFVDIYGDDCALAWDPDRRDFIYANLAPTVRAFFRNGGVRCWIIRVAGEEAETARFPVPGLLGMKAGGELAPAIAEARSEGQWSRVLSVTPAVSLRNVATRGFDLKSVDMVLWLMSAESVQAGDLLSLSFDNQGYGVMFVAQPDRDHVPIPGQGAVWFRTSHPQAAVPTSQAEAFYAARERYDVFELGFKNQQLTLVIAATLESAPAPGSMVRVKCGAETVWIRVRSARTVPVAESPIAVAVELAGDGLWQIPGPPSDLQVLGSPPVASGEYVTLERISFDLWVRQGEQPVQRMTDLGFQQAHPRFWGALPNDQELYPEIDFVDVPAERSQFAGLWKDASGPRFALSGPGADDQTIYFPAGMPFVPENYASPLPTAKDSAAQDGLSKFGYSLFIDERLNEALLTDFVATTDFKRYQGPRPEVKDPRRRDSRLLRKLHAAFGVDEVTILSVPDAVQRGWERRDVKGPEPPKPSDRLPGPEWGNFLECSLRIVEFPKKLESSADVSGTIQLKWTEVNGASYQLEVATTPDFADSQLAATTSDTKWTLLGRAPGNYYFRVRAILDGTLSSWSDAAVTQVLLASDLIVNPIAIYDARDLLEVHRAITRMCAARGDLFGVLSLPEHYRETDAKTHIAALKAQPESGSTAMVQAKVKLLEFAEAAAFTYVGIYLPWPIVHEDADPENPVSIPPDGAACGILARRALDRGAWIAPANETVHDVVALTPRIAPSSWQELQDSQVNVVRQDPRGFLCLSADTLATADYVDLRPINVRRLLMLLRRLAVRDGASYVFEPNDDSFHRLVQRSFEAMLDYMFLRGAFAGDKPGTAFQVVTGESLNTPQSMEQGKLIVELRVAPAIPMHFMTVRLLQSGDRALVVEEA